VSAAVEEGGVACGGEHFIISTNATHTAAGLTTSAAKSDVTSHIAFGAVTKGHTGGGIGYTGWETGGDTGGGTGGDTGRVT